VKVKLLEALTKGHAARDGSNFAAGVHQAWRLVICTSIYPFPIFNGAYVVYIYTVN
jgi:hypothetical protein